MKKGPKDLHDCVSKEDLQQIIRGMGYSWDGNGNVQQKVEMAVENQRQTDRIRQLELENEKKAASNTLLWKFIAGNILVILGAIAVGGVWVGNMQSDVMDNTEKIVANQSNAVELYDKNDRYQQQTQTWVRDNFASLEKMQQLEITVFNLEEDIKSHINHPNLHQNRFAGLEDKLDALEDEMEATMDYKDQVLELRVTEKVNSNKSTVNELKQDLKELSRRQSADYIKLKSNQ